jgi:pyruvate/2-oxoglutarate dehydrogenase complex dihydrolipoamide acyltransferase (E2) component
MTDLKPLISSDATDFERELLSVAAGERPSPELQLRMERAIGLEPAALPAAASVAGRELSGTHAAVKAAAAPRVDRAVLEAALGIGVGAGLLVGGLALFSSGPPAELAPAIRASPASAPAAPAPVAAPALSAAPVDMSRELREEVDLLDRVRAAVALEDAHTATELLDSYFARFPEGALTREAGVLRTRTTELARTRALPPSPDPPSSR